MQSTGFSNPPIGQTPPPYPLPTYHPAPPPVQPQLQPAPIQPSVNQANTTVVLNQPGGGSGTNRLLVVAKHQLNARKWNSGFCGCLNDLGGCVLGTLCLPIMLCRLANRLGECALVTCCVPAGFGTLRTKLRVMGGIKGTICDDCLVTTCCGPCAACQMYRELDDMQL